MTDGIDLMGLVQRRAFYVALGQLLTARRIEAGMHQRWLAAELGISPSGLCLIEQGRRETSSQYLWDMARLLYVSPGALLREAAAIAATAA